MSDFLPVGAQVEMALAAITSTEDTRGRFTLRLDALPQRTYSPDGRLVGYEVMVKLYQGKKELRIDPHRVFVNPPLKVVTGPPSFDWDEVKAVPRTTAHDPQAAFWEVLWQSVTGTPNAKQWRTRGTVTTVFSGTTDGHVNSHSSSGFYSDARAGTGSATLTADNSSTTFTVGQKFTSSKLNTYDCWEGFLSFDTSAITDTDTVSQVDLSVWLTTDNSTTDFTMNARSFDWGASLTTADYVAGASLSGNTLVASISSSGIGSTGAYKTLTSQAAFLTAPNIKTGTVFVLLCSSLEEAGTTPTTDESMVFSSADNTGTTQDPKLVVTSAAPNVTSTGSIATRTMAMAGTASSPFVASGAAALKVPALASTGRWGVRFPANPLSIKIEILINGAWVDISQYMYQRADMIIRSGRPDESTTLRTSSCSFVLNNRYKQFSPKNTAGAFYPFLTRNTQIRVSIDPTLSSSDTYYSGYRFWGEVPSWPPSWDKTGTDVYVQITANGLLRRLTQNTRDAGSALYRYYTKLTGSSAPAAYWPGEDGNNSTLVASAVSGISAMTVTGTPDYAADSSIVGSDSFIQVNGSTWTGTAGSFSMGGTDTYTTPGTYTWTAPGDVTSVTSAECWGSGAGGQGTTAGGHGGGGGEYAKETSVAVTGGSGYTVIVGSPGTAGADGATSSFAGNSVTVTAHGGLTAGTGGTGSANTTHHDGGAGAAGNSSPGGYGGGGGSSGGSSATGNAGSGQTAGAAPTGGGPGGTGGSGSACVDTLTEIYTLTEGWKPYDRVRSGDITVGLDPDGRPVQSYVRDVRVYDGTFTLLELDNGGAGTPEHRWRVDGGEYVTSREMNVQAETEVDRVWCPVTSTGNWLAWRNGNIFFTGNKPG